MHFNVQADEVASSHLASVGEPAAGELFSPDPTLFMTRGELSPIFREMTGDSPFLARPWEGDGLVSLAFRVRSAICDGHSQLVHVHVRVYVYMKLYDALHVEGMFWFHFCKTAIGMHLHVHVHVPEAAHFS